MSLTLYPAFGIIVNLLDAFSTMDTAPDGVIIPPLPAEAESVKTVTGANETAIV